MINYIDAIICGSMQGITEFLPISSSGHLVILHKLINIPIKNELVFDVWLHLASLLAIIYFFRQDILSLLIFWAKSLNGRQSDQSRISWLIILGTVPSVFAGWLFSDIIAAKLHSPLLVSVMLVIVGILFIVFEKISRFSDDYEQLNWRKTLVIGSMQALALIPGVSRSGITIIAGMGAGLKREAAVKFSFLLSIPVIASAAVKELPQFFNYNIENKEIVYLAIAFGSCYIFSFLAIKYFLRFTKNHTLNIFAVYRFILAAVILILFFAK